jgi:putative spermidine/putrescine transport system permease protein
MAVAADTRPAPAPAPETVRRRWRPSGIGGWFVWGAVVFFFINLFGLVATVALDAFATTWFGGWIPDGFTTHWFTDAWTDFALTDVLITTAQVALIVVALSIIIGVPAAYALARRNFPGKQVITLLFLLPILIPPITYGIPLATLLYKLQLAGSIQGVILANLVPAVPFVVLITIPFVEQIDPKIENAARMCGASTFTIFTRVIGPLLLPGVLAAGILILVRTVGMFELTFLTAGPSSTTLVVVLYDAVFGAGIRAPQEVDAMALIYTMSMLVLLLIALRFVNPTQLVTRVGDN